MISTSCKLREIEDYTQKLTKIVSTAMRGEEPPIELILKHNRGVRSNKVHAESDLKAMTLKQLTY